MTARFIKSVLLCSLLLWSTPVWSRETPSPQDRQWFASTDPERKNKDYVLLKPRETRRIPLGAGQLQRLWSTASEPEKIVLQLNNGTKTIDLLSDGRPLEGQFLDKAFTLYSFPSDLTSRLYLGGKSALIATNRSAKEQKFYYQVTIGDNGIFDYGQMKWLKGGTKNPSDAKVEQAQSIAPGRGAVWAQSPQSITSQGVGVIRDLTIQLEPPTIEAWSTVRLRAFWDGGETPNIDVPLLALTGQFFEMRPVKNALFDFDGKTLRRVGSMPFGRDSRIVLVNTGQMPVSATISYTTGGGLSSSQARFCAAYGSARTQKGKPLQMLNVEGKGAFIGLNLAIAPVLETRRFNFAYLEGNEIITADGKKFEGTGTEDYFDSAWYFPEKPYNHPYAGMTYKGKEPPKISMYRLMLADVVPFQKSLKFEMGHGSSNSANDLEYHWVAFWYQQPPLKFEISDELKGQWGASNVAGSTPAAAGEPALPWGRRIFFLLLGGALSVLVIWTLMRIVRRPS